MGAIGFAALGAIGALQGQPAYALAAALVAGAAGAGVVAPGGVWGLLHVGQVPSWLANYTTYLSELHEAGLGTVLAGLAGRALSPIADIVVPRVHLWRHRPLAWLVFGTLAWGVARSARRAPALIATLLCYFLVISLWPFPSQALRELATRVRGILVVELSAGQMLEDVRLAVEGITPVAFHGRMGGMVPSPGDVLTELRQLWAITEPLEGAPEGDARHHRSRRSRHRSMAPIRIGPAGEILDDLVDVDIAEALTEVWR